MKRNTLKAIVLCVLVFLFIMPISLPLFSQDISRTKNLDTDSIAALLNGKVNNEQIDLINLLSSALCMKHADSSLILAKKAIQLSDSLDYEKGLANGYFNMGSNFLVMDSLYPTMVNYLKAIRIFEEIDPSVEFADLCMRIGTLNYFTGRYKAARDYYWNSIHVFNEISEFGELPMCFHSLALSYYYAREYDSSLFYTEIAMSYADSTYLQYYYNNYGRVHQQYFFKTGDTLHLEKAINWSLKGLESPATTAHFKPSFNANLNYYYSKYGLEKKDSMGLAYLLKVIPGAKNIKDAFYNIPVAYRGKAKFKRKRGEFDSAIILYSESIQVIENELNNFSILDYSDPIFALQSRDYIKKEQQWAQYGLYNVFTILGKGEDASEHFALYVNAVNEVKRTRNQDLIAVLEADSEYEKTQNQITLLASENKLKDLKILQSRIINYGLGSIFIVLVFLGYLFIRQNKMKAEHKTILLEQKLLRLQMNPHFIFNALSNILNLIDNNQNKKAAGYLTTFSKLLRTTLESTRENFVPFEKEVTSLRNYLELQKLRYGNKFNYTVEVDEKIEEDDMAIPPMLVQPIIENAIEHGIRHKTTPGRIDVRFNLKGKKIICEVEDDGVGREKAWEAEVKEKIGHKSLATEIIRDRIKTLNKKFKEKIKLEIIDLKSETMEALGTKVVLDIPYGSVY